MTKRHRWKDQGDGEGLRRCIDCDLWRLKEAGKSAVWTLDGCEPIEMPKSPPCPPDGMFRAAGNDAGPRNERAKR